MQAPVWIDTHCHLDAPEFDADRAAVRAAARLAGVQCCVIPTVQASNFAPTRAIAHAQDDVYALGIHPLYVPQATGGDLQALEQALTAHADDARLVAVGEIGLDFFVPELCTPAMRSKQHLFFEAQLRLAQRFGLPVILHSRRALDQVLRALRQTPTVGGIAHAFVGSAQQAQQSIDLGLKLGFGGAMTYERATRLRQLAASLPLDAIVLETDAPDMPPRWLYKTAAEREAGQTQSRNTPAELPRLGQVLADLRGLTQQAICQATFDNARAVLPLAGGSALGQRPA